MNKAIFLDRDGTLNSDEGHYYVHRVSDLLLNPGVIENLKCLYDKGFKLIVISNQAGIAKNEYKKHDTDRFHEEINNILLKNGCNIEEFYYCPHHDKVSACLCRKPLPLLIEKAIARFDIDKTQSYMIGDSKRDAEASEAAGIKAFIIEKNANMKDVVDIILS